MAIESVATLRDALESTADDVRIWADRMDQVGAILAYACKGGARAHELVSAAHFLADDGADSLRLVAEEIDKVLANAGGKVAS